MRVSVVNVMISAAGLFAVHAGGPEVQAGFFGGGAGLVVSSGFFCDAVIFWSRAGHCGCQAW